MILGGHTFPFISTIKRVSIFRHSAYISTVILSLLFLAIICPLYLVPDGSEAAAGTATESTLTFAFVDNKNTASVSLDVSNTSGSFATSASSELAEFSLSTNNATGYTLNLRISGSETTLAQGANSISAINDSKLSSEFAVNTWGLLPSKYNSTANTTNYYPASNAGFTIEETNTANSSNGIDNPNTYTIGLGIKADFTVPAGTYTNSTIIAEYVANPVNYSITYDKGNISGTPSNIPAVQSGLVSATSITLNNTVPTYTGYDFKGWCLGTVTTNTTTNNDSCSGTIYNPNGNGTNLAFGIDQTINNTATLHAMWNIKTFILTVQNGGNTTVTGSGTYQYGQTVTITATPTSNTTCTTYGTPSWAKTSGEGTLNSASGTSATFTMGLGDATVKATSSATNIKQTVSFATSNASGITFNGANYTNNGSVQIECGTYNIATNGFPTGYKFGSWVVSGSLTLGSSATTASNTVTVAGNGMLTLNGTKSTYSLTITFAGAGVSNVQVRTASGTGGTLKGTVSTSGGSVSGLTYNDTYYLYPTYTSGYTLDNWKKTSSYGALAGVTTANTTTTTSNPTFTMGAGNGAVTITGKKNYMQSLTKADCQSQANNGNITVYDKRDESDYTVRYINDACWMTQNLRITKSTGQADWTISSTDSNFNNVSTWNIHSADLKGSSGSYTQTQSHIADSDDISASSSASGGPYTANQLGVWYNFCAVSANNSNGCNDSGDYTPGTGTVTGDICPAGWHLPTRSTAPGAFSGITSSGSDFSPIYGGYYRNGSITFATDYGFWWSSTADGASNQYLFYSWRNYLYPGDYGEGKCYGRYVRCVRTS